MHSLLPSVYLLLASAAVATCQQWDDCKAHLDGHLPYYVPPSFTFSGRVRRYYVAAEVEPWDYAPTGTPILPATLVLMNIGWDNWLGVPMTESFRAQTWGYIASNTSIGSTLDKAQYKGYTDESFKERTKHPDWLGLQGPILRAEVGDMIEVSIIKLRGFLASVSVEIC